MTPHPRRSRRPIQLWRLCAVPLLMLPLFAQAADGLEQALDATLSRNPEIKSKHAELESLGYRVDEARSGRYPSFSVEARTVNDASNKGVARIQQPIYSFGKIDTNISLAERRLDTARFELLDLHRRLIEETAVAYEQSHALRRRIKVAQANVDEHESLHRMISRRQEGGVASDADARLAMSRLTQARAQLDLLKAQLAKALQDLYSLTRIEFPAEQPVPEDLVARIERGSLASELQTAYSKVLLQRARLSIVQAEGDVRRTELLPTISARIDRDIAPSAGVQTSSTRAGIVLEARLEGAGVAGYKRLQSEAARLQSAREDLDTAYKEAERRLANLRVDMAAQRQMIIAQGTIVDSVDDTLKSFLRQYDAGRKSWVDVLNTQRELADARQQLEQNRAAWLESALRAAAMMGDLDTAAGLEKTSSP